MENWEEGRFSIKTMLQLTSKRLQCAIQNCGFQLHEHPPYSSDLVSSDYYLFPKMKKELNGGHYATNDDIIDAVN